MPNANIIDLRSDTVTRPTPAMLRAMTEAEVGDDVLGDDPTVIALQNKVADLLGKEAALFVPSGTMANQIAVRTHTEPGDEIIIHHKAHAFMFETGALGGICGVQTQMLPGDRGILELADIAAAIRPSNYHCPPTRLVCIENTHNQGGGTVYPLERVKEIYLLVRERKISLHMDGARLWNACIASGHRLSDYAQYADSVSVCLSKGMGAPAGSVLTGSKEFIHRAKRFRKMLGGAMRQSGILAAAGIYAIDHHYDRLREDHENARHLAESLAKIPGIKIRVEEVESNLVYFGVESHTSKWLEEELAKHGVWLFAERNGDVRAVTHLDVSRDQINRALEIIGKVVHE